MILMKLRTQFLPKDKSAELINDMIDNGAERTDLLDEDFIYINPRHISMFNESSEGHTVLRMNNSETWHVLMPPHTFIKKLERVLRIENETLSIIQLSDAG